MPKVTLDMNTFKALASNTRLMILRALDGKKLNLKDICKQTKLNKATLHEHLTKLSEAGLVKRKERSGHKWVYYSLTWRGESLLHPENTKIVVLFSITFFTIAAGIVQMINYVKGYVVARAVNFIGRDSTALYSITENKGDSLSLLYESGGRSISEVANVPLENQTAYDLSSNLIKNSKIVGYGGAIDTNQIDWLTVPDSPMGYVNETFKFKLQQNATIITEKAQYFCTDDGLLKEGGKEVTDNIACVPQNMMAIAHDQTIQYISIACIIIAGIILSIAIWRYYKNKNAKL